MLSRRRRIVRGSSAPPLGLVLGLALVLPPVLGPDDASATTLTTHAMSDVQRLVDMRAGVGITNTPDVTASFNGAVRAVVYDNGVVYVGGDFTAATDNGQTMTRNHLAAIDPGTGHLLSWNPGVDGPIYSLTVGGGYVYLGGTFATVGGAHHSHLARVSVATGGVDNAFKAATNGNVRALVMQGNVLYAGGGFATADGQARGFLAAFDATTGALSSTWRPVADDVVRTFTLDNGWLYMGGSFHSVNGLTRGRFLAPIGPTTGALQANWTSSVGYAVHRVVATPTVLYIAADGPGGHLRAVSTTGGAIWDLTGDGGVQAVVLINGTLYAGGHFDNVCTTSRTGTNGVCLDGKVTRHKLFAADTSGTLLPWAPEANSPLGAFSMASDVTTGRLFVGGAFTTFNSGKIKQAGFAEFG